MSTNQSSRFMEKALMICLFIKASCDIAFKVARERGTIVAGGIVQTAVFKHVKVVNNNVQQ